MKSQFIRKCFIDRSSLLWILNRNWKKIGNKQINEESIKEKVNTMRITTIQPWEFVIGTSRNKREGYWIR